MNTSPSDPVLEADHLEYFNRGRAENPRFWACFEERPRFQGQTVIDVGCGHGSLCLSIAEEGANRVIGLDLNEKLIDFALANLRRNCPHMISKVDFACADLRDWSREQVDLFVSKSSFEHILDLPAVLDEMKLRLKSGGRIYAGFDPLWPSPYGGHGRILEHLPIPWMPWGHLLFSERFILRRVNRGRDKPVASIQELGLNMLSVHDYRRIFSQTGLRTISFRVNYPAGSLRGRVLRFLSRLPVFSKYTTYSVYAVLEK